MSLGRPRGGSDEEAEVSAKQTWRPIKTAPQDGVWSKIDLWLHIPPSPRSMGWGDSFRVPDCWWQDGKWMHYDRGAPREIEKDYITHWMPLPEPPAVYRRKT